MKNKAQFIIIGGGIVGCSIAREIALRKMGSTIILEKEPELGRHTSGRNSGVIHSGINQKPGTLKAKMCVEGSRLLRNYCDQKKVPMNEGGTMVVARNSKELNVIEELLDLGNKCGVEGLEILTREQLLKKEPDAIAEHALFSPNGATVDQLALLKSVAEDAIEHGVEIIYEAKVTKIEKNTVFTKGGAQYSGEHIINCAGLYADKIAHTMDVGKEYRVIPFRGEYYEISGPRVNSMIYQPPDLKFPFLSIHLTREVDGRVLAGPSAVISFGRESYDKEFKFLESLEMIGSSNFQYLCVRPEFIRLAVKNFKTSLFKRSFLKEASHLAQNMSFKNVKRAQAGIRAQLVSDSGKFVDDMLVEKTTTSTHVLNAISPAMTCSLAFAKYIVDYL